MDSPLSVLGRDTEQDNPVLHQEPSTPSENLSSVSETVIRFAGWRVGNDEIDFALKIIQFRRVSIVDRGIGIRKQNFDLTPKAVPGHILASYVHVCFEDLQTDYLFDSSDSGSSYRKASGPRPPLDTHAAEKILVPTDASEREQARRREREGPEWMQNFDPAQTLGFFGTIIVRSVAILGPGRRLVENDPL